MKRKLFFMLILTFIFIIPFVFAETNQQTLGVFEQNKNISLIQNCLNSTYSNISRVTYPNGSFAINSQTSMTKNGDDYNYNFILTSATGQYLVYGSCDENGIKTNWVYDLMATPNGENTTIGGSIFYIGILAILIIFLIMSIYSFVAFDNLLNKVGMIGLSYLLLIAITFIGWNMANDFLTSSPFLIEIFKILFYILMIGLFPLLIGAFVWYIIMLFKIKEIENLMKHGMSQDEAERRTSRRRR